MRLKYLAIIIICISFCTVQAQNKNHDIYVIGTEGNVVTLWKDGIVQNLTKGTYDTEVNSVYVSSGNVYITGWEANIQNKMVAKLWKNGIVQSLTEGTHDAEANSVYVSSGNVYVAGRNGNVVKLWINGMAHDLTNGYYPAGANCVYVSGSDVYVVGFDKGVYSRAGRLTFGIATVWKNGIEQNLSDGNDEAEANSVFVSGNDVYVAGYENNDQGISVAVLWKNGVVQNLTDGSADASANSVYVSSNDVYVAGYNNDTAVLWENGVVQNLTDGTHEGEANSVYVSDSDVYVAGYDNGIAVLWKNGVAQNLFEGIANSVFVTNSNSQQIEKSIGTLIVVSNKAYFHNQPSEATIHKGYLQKGDTATYSRESNGYLYVTFTNSSGQTSTGWINKKEVEIVAGN